MGMCTSVSPKSKYELSEHLIIQFTIIWRHRITTKSEIKIQYKDKPDKNEVAIGQLKDRENEMITIV